MLDRGLAVALGALVHAVALGVGAQRADMQKAMHALAPAGLRYALGQQHVGPREVRPVRLADVAMQDAHQVHDHVATTDQAIQRRVIVDVGLDQRDGGKDLQFAAPRQKARGHDPLVQAAGQAGNQVTADDTGATNDKDTHAAASCLSGSSPDSALRGRQPQARIGGPAGEPPIAIRKPAIGRRPEGRRCHR
ncbi:hypothetical protein G6F65_014799 [Rhizopus arrhizus]|nr:hypothetical protein G6F65_014799 [Rhizopus arrhizus]